MHNTFRVGAVLIALTISSSVTLTAQDVREKVPPDELDRRAGSGKWMLGVRLEETTKGCKVLEVIKGSPAHKIGLEANDYILAVNGNPVGKTDGYIFSVASELRHSGKNAKLKIWDCRTGKITDDDVALVEKK
jgi:S1-C subfamily serine protease